MSDCETCDFEWAIRLPDGEIVTVASGKLKKVNKRLQYEDQYVPAWTLGDFTEYLGGRLGQLPQCVREKLGLVEGVEVLVEGRWKPLSINI